MVTIVTIIKPPPIIYFLNSIPGWRPPWGQKGLAGFSFSQLLFVTPCDCALPPFSHLKALPATERARQKMYSQPQNIPTVYPQKGLPRRLPGNQAILTSRSRVACPLLFRDLCYAELLKLWRVACKELPQHGSPTMSHLHEKRVVEGHNMRITTQWSIDLDVCFATGTLSRERHLSEAVRRGG